MDVVHQIIDAVGGVNALSSATGFPQQTVSEWRTRTPPDIPPWRRSAVLEAVKRLDREGLLKGELPAAAFAYLASLDRRPRIRPTPAEPQASAA